MEKPKKHKTLLIFIILITIICTLVTGLLTSFDNLLKDKIYQKSSIVSDDIYVIGIDEETLSHYGKFETFIREKTEELVSSLNSLSILPTWYHCVNA